jgi:hypothetical protein
MPPLDFVTLNAKEDRLERDQSTPSPRASDMNIATPKTPTKKLTDRVPKLTLNDSVANFAIICDGQRFMTHKSVLYTASSYFQRMLRFDGKVHGLCGHLADRLN